MPATSRGRVERVGETILADPDGDDVHRAPVVDVLGPADLRPRRRARPARTGGRGSCSTGGSAPRAAAPGDSVSAKRCSSASDRPERQRAGDELLHQLGLLVGRSDERRRRAASSWPRPRARARSMCGRSKRLYRTPSGEAGDRRVAPPGRLDHPVERLAQPGRDGSGPSSRATTIGSCSLAPLLGDEDAQQRVRRARRSASRSVTP